MYRPGAEHQLREESGADGKIVKAFIVLEVVFMADQPDKIAFHQVFKGQEEAGGDYGFRQGTV